MSQEKKANSILENMKLAKAVLIACIILALCVFAPMKLSGKRDKALDVFLNGKSDKYRTSVYTDLKSIAENANRLANLCEREGSADQESVKKLRESALAISESEDPAVMLSAFAGISLHAENAYQSLSSSAQEKCYDEYVNLIDVANVIKRDSYFSEAEEFNRTRNAFPAVLLAGIFGIDELPMGGK